MATARFAAQHQAHALPPARRRLHVLVVEDDPDCAESLAFFLRFHEIAADIAANGAVALASAHANPPDVVLMNTRLPDMDGYQLAGQLRHLAGSKLHLVALTGDCLEQEQQRVADETFDDYFVKPADPADILACLHDHAKSL